MLAKSCDHKLDDIISAMEDAAKAYEIADESDLETAMRAQIQQLRDQLKTQQDLDFARQRAIDKEAIADAKYALSQFDDAMGIYIELVSDFAAVNDVNGSGRVASGISKCRRGLLLECVKQNNEDLLQLAVQLAAEEPEEWSDVNDDEVGVTSGSKVVPRFSSTTTTRAITLVEAPPAICCNELWPMPDRTTWDPAVSLFSPLEIIDEHSEVVSVSVDVGAVLDKRELVIVRHKRMLPDGRFVMLEYSVPSAHMQHFYQGGLHKDDDEDDTEASASAATSSDAGTSLFGGLFGGDTDSPELEHPAAQEPKKPELYLWAEIVSSVSNDFRSTVTVIRSADLLLAGGGFLGSVMSAARSLMSENPSQTVARAIAVKYAKKSLMGLMHDADTLLSLGAFDESLQKYISAEERAKYLDDSEFIVRANVGKSNCLRGKERMALVDRNRVKQAQHGLGDLLSRANKLRAEVHLPNLEADDTWLLYFESAFNKAAKRSEIEAKVDQIHEELT